MATGTPDTAKQIEDRTKADVQREAPDSNPYLRVHWLRTLIAAIARRMFDFYTDLRRVELRLFPDTADDETAPRWGNIFVGQKNAASKASGKVVAQGTSGATIGVGELMTANSNDYTVTANAAISNQTISVASITRTGTTATVTTIGNHELASAVPVTIAGADQAEYNLTDAAITVIGEKTFTYEVSGSPASPATGTITASFTSASVEIESVGFGSGVNLDADTPVTLQSPIVGVNDTLHVDYGTIGGGSDEEATDEYKARYLEKIRDPVAHYNKASIIAEAKKVTGVTRVFVEEAGDNIGTQSVTSITRSGNVATVTTPSPHGYYDGGLVTITGANEIEYNEVDTRIIVESDTVFHYIVSGAPASPATGTILASSSIPGGQTRVFFMRDNDVDPIPSSSEVATVKAALDAIRPANTMSADLIVAAPTAVPVDFTFTSILPDTSTMRAAISENLSQFFEEETTVGTSVDEDSYRAAIINTVDPDTGDRLLDFVLSAPSGDITIISGEIATKGAVTYP